TKLFLIFKKRGFRAGYWDKKITVIGGLLFYDRGAPPTGLKRSDQTLIKTKTSKPPPGGASL
ncbi:MAG: hypothetical protein Q8M94_17000, partial [Ignavibacteria bacterium]|nr:hypothetical protein [Ignavibacteria bacterium]